MMIDLGTMKAFNPAIGLIMKYCTFYCAVVSTLISRNAKLRVAKVRQCKGM